MGKFFVMKTAPIGGPSGQFDLSLHCLTFHLNHPNKLHELHGSTLSVNFMITGQNLGVAKYRLL